jgi:hypothetical protein
MNGGVDEYIHDFLASEIDAGEWLVSRSYRCTPAEIPPIQIGENTEWVSGRHGEAEIIYFTGIELRPHSHPASS